MSAEFVASALALAAFPSLLFALVSLRVIAARYWESDREEEGEVFDGSNGCGGKHDRA